MPAEQRGSAYRTTTGWGVRYVDQYGRRQRKAGFKSKSAALAFYRDEIRPRLAITPALPGSTTLADFVEIYLDAHALDVETSTLAVLRDRLRRAVETFGEVPLARLEGKSAQIAAWRATLSTGSRYGATQALRQALDQAVRWNVIGSIPPCWPARTPRRSAPNRAVHARRARPHLRRARSHAPVVRVAAATGLRPCEWLALEWRDVRSQEGVILVERTYSRGALRAYGRRAAAGGGPPLPRGSRALEGVPRRIDTQLIFPRATAAISISTTGDPGNGRPRSSVAASVTERSTRSRHTFATSALAAGLGLFELSRFMGTSVEMIDRTYGHLAVGAEDAARAKLDALDGHAI